MASGRARLAQLHPQVKAAASWCLDVADYYGVPVRVTSTYRSWQAQADLWRNYQRCLASGEFGRTSRCRYPAAPPGESAHNYGLAWDSVVEPRYQAWWNQVRAHVGFQVPTDDEIHAAVPAWRNYVP